MRIWRCADVAVVKCNDSAQSCKYGREVSNQRRNPHLGLSEQKLHLECPCRDDLGRFKKPVAEGVAMEEKEMIDKVKTNLHLETHDFDLLISDTIQNVREYCN